MDALEFTLEHEAAHHEIQEALTNPADTDSDLSIETFADARAAENLLLAGDSPEEVSEKSQKAFELMTLHNPTRASFVQARADQLQAHLARVMQARNERLASRMAMR